MPKMQTCVYYENVYARQHLYNILHTVPNQTVTVVISIILLLALDYECLLISAVWDGR